MKKFSLGLLLGICIPPLAAYLFILSGGMPVRTKGAPLPFERYLAKKALHRAFANEENTPSPFPASEQNLVEGAKTYRLQCAVCHGVPNEPISAIADGLFPKAPQLFKHGVDDDPIGEIYWKVKNGIRLTGMPGFEDHLSEAELWKVSIFLKAGNEIPESAKKELTQKP